MSDTLYLPFDTETGGITHESCLLSAHFAVCDAQYNVIDELDLLTKPDDGRYVVTAEALSINKINLIEHDKVALTYGQAGGKLREFILRHSNNGKIKLVPMGKNIGFDVAKITGTILGKKTWNQYVSYRVYDMTTLVLYLKRTGKLPADAPDSLEGLAKKFFGLEYEAHTARGDNMVGIEVFKRLEAL